MISRQDLGSWLNGGPAKTQDYPGERLGRPLSGPGSVARIGARVIGLFIDWLIAMGIAGALLPQWNHNGLMNLLVLFLMNVLFVAVVGRTVGHWIVGLQVQTMDGQAAGLIRALIRAFLLILVIPPLVYDQDQRGLHDRAGGTILVKVR